MPHPFQIFSQSDDLIQIVDINSHTEWQTVQIQISWLLKKPTDLDLYCLQRQDISGFSRTRVNSFGSDDGSNDGSSHGSLALDGHMLPAKRLIYFLFCVCIVYALSGVDTLTLVMLNKLRCHTYIQFSANQITRSRLLI